MAPRIPANGMTLFLIGAVALMLLSVAIMFFLGDPRPLGKTATADLHTVPTLHSPTVSGAPVSVAVHSHGELLPLPGKGPVQVELKYLGGEAEERIMPKQGGRLEGRVVDRRLEGLGGVHLEIIGGPQDGLSTITRVDGTFTFASLLPGTHFFKLKSARRTAVRIQRVKSRGTTRREFMLGVGINFAIAPRDEKNKPIPGVEVEIGAGLYKATTDEEGLAWFEGIPASPRVIVGLAVEGKVPIRQEINLRGVPDGPVVLPALMPGGQVRGRVKSWPGGNLPIITVVPRNNRISPYQVAWEQWYGIPVDVDGWFHLSDLPATQLVDIRVFHSGGVSEPRVRAVRPNPQSPTTISFVIKRGKGRVSGLVKDADGNPLGQAKVTLESADPTAMLRTLYPSLADAPSLARLPIPAALHREQRVLKNGKFDFAIGDHPEGTGSLLLTASAPGYRPFRQIIKRAFDDLKIQLFDENRNGKITLKATEWADMPPVEWYLEGLPVGDNFAGPTPEKSAVVSGLLTGFYEMTVRRGDQVLSFEAEFLVGEDAEVQL